MDNGKRKSSTASAGEPTRLRPRSELDDAKERIHELVTRNVELEEKVHVREIELIGLKEDIRELQEIIDRGPIITEEDYLRKIERQSRIAIYAIEGLKERGSQFRCNWCLQVTKIKKMSIWWNENTGEVLFLHFSGCMNFPEPFRNTQAGERGWHRIDPWQKYKRTYPKLRKENRNRTWQIAKAPTKQTKLPVS